MATILSSRPPQCLVLLLIITNVLLQTNAVNEFFRGPKPKQESRIFGSSGDFRSKDKESTEPRFPAPFRLLIVGDDHAQGCGWKSFPVSSLFLY